MIYYYLCIYNEKSDSNVVSMSVYRRTYEFPKQFLEHDVCLIFFDLMFWTLSYNTQCVRYTMFTEINRLYTTTKVLITRIFLEINLFLIHKPKCLSLQLYFIFLSLNEAQNVATKCRVIERRIPASPKRARRRYKQDAPHAPTKKFKSISISPGF